ncbi:hypothetical protein ACWDE9_23550, partial [Streptomyces olivaceoviridis]
MSAVPSGAHHHVRHEPGEPAPGAPDSRVPCSPGRSRSGGRLRAWAELLRLPALFTVPGDGLAGAAAVGARPGRGCLLAIGSSLLRCPRRLPGHLRPALDRGRPRRH